MFISRLCLRDQESDQDLLWFSCIERIIPCFNFNQMSDDMAFYHIYLWATYVAGDSWLC